MGDVIVQGSGSSEELRRKAQQAFGGEVSITERQGGERVVHLDSDQTQKLQRMRPHERNAALGGRVRQQLNG
jgi:hypothetical protein